MSEQNPNALRNLRSPWLIAAWPGMGKVALSAAGYLIEQLGAAQVGEFEGADPSLFDLDRVQIEDGVVQPARLPENRLYAWRNPSGGRDLIIFVGEAQPATGGYRLCHDLLRFARELDVERVITFASMVTPSDPTKPSQVFTVATEPALLEEVRRVRGSLVTIKEGEIVGLNGTLLGAAASRGMEALGLLGEVPQIAVNLPYLKATHAVLELFCALAGVTIDFTELEEKAASLERGLQELLRQIRAITTKESDPPAPEQGSWTPGQEAPGEASAREEAGEEEGEEPRLRLSPEALSLIESLFLSAEQDRARALELKRELDKHGAFAAYEDRFLDLFKKRDDPPEHASNN